MLKRGFFIVLFSLIVSNSLFSQALDTSIVLKNLKIRLFNETGMGFLSESALNDYLKRDLSVSVLNSKGFDSFIFFKISSQVLSIDTINNRQILVYKLPPCLQDECYFVYAFNTQNKEFYRLKGTYENDFSSLYKSLNGKWAWWKPNKKIDKSTVNRFVKDYWVEGIDLKCLLWSLKREKGSCLDYYSPKLEVY